MPIKDIRHNGLRQLFDRDKKQGVPPKLAKKLKHVLATLDEIKTPADLDGIPGLRCHSLVGDKKGFYSIKVSKNVRVIFRMHEEDVYDVNLMDYH